MLKQCLEINQNKCIACGNCYSMTSLIVETKSGHAKAISPHYLTALELDEIKTIVNDCPVQAIKIKEIKLPNKKIAKQILVDKIINGLNKIKMPVIKFSEFTIDVKDYKLNIIYPYSSISSTTKYKSVSSARSKQREVFERYSMKRVNNYALEILSKYQKYAT